VKPKDLIKLLEELPSDAEIVIEGYRCDILADYQYAADLKVEAVVAKRDERGIIHANYSNYSRGKDETVYVLRWL
jgi:hypothetical protein